MPRKEKEKASLSSIWLDSKPPYADKVAVKPYQVGYVTPQFQKLDVKEEISGSM